METITMTLAEMKEKLIKNANLFYNGLETEIPDAVYDGLLKLILTEDSTFNVYDHIVYTNDGVQVPHDITFRDFTKNNDISEFSDEEGFIDYKSKYYVLPKLDGSSVVTYYNNDGTLDKILSRSDDETGFLNTNKLKNKVPAVIPGCIRMLAEAVVPLKDGGRAKANGMINSKYMQDDVDQYLTLVPFDYYKLDGSKVPNTDIEVTDYEVFCRIRDKGEFVFNNEVYPCDGIVGYPRDDNEVLDIHKLYYTESAITEITEISLENAWTGIKHPVANFETVLLDGTYVSRASMSNYQLLKESRIYPGVKVKVIKANMTIPKIIEVVSEPDEVAENEYFNSIVCSDCGSPVREIGVDVVCTNPTCDWWVRKMLTSIAEVTENNTQEISELIWNSVEVPKSVIDLLVTEEFLSKFNSDISYALYFLGLPRLSEAKIEAMVNAKAEENSGLICEVIYGLASWNQWWYYEVIIEKLKGLLMKYQIIYELDNHDLSKVAQ